VTEQHSDSIIKRIKALLAMAEHPNSNENEASIAMQKAQEMLLQYNLTMASVKTNEKSINESIQHDQIHAEHGFVWKSNLLNVIAKSNLCYVVTTYSTDTAHLFGKITNVNVTVEMFVWVVEQLEKISLAKFLSYKNNGGEIHGKSWKASFFAGAIHIINQRLQKPFEMFAKGDGYSIVLINDKAIQIAVQEIFPQTHKVTRHVKINSGYMAGKEAGNRINFVREKQLNNRHFVLGSGK